MRNRTTDSSGHSPSQSSGNNASDRGVLFLSSNASIDLRQARSCKELSSPQVERVPLHRPAAAHTMVLHRAEVAVLLAVFPSDPGAQEHDGGPLCSPRRT